MRSILLIVLAVAATLGGFALYCKLEAPPVLAPAVHPLTPGPMETHVEMIGGGAGAWVRVFDRKTHRLVEQLRADRYDPRGAGLYHAVHPEAEFFFGDAAQPQIVRVVGVDGDLTTGPGQADSNLGMSMPGSLSRGSLNDVKVSIYPDPAAAARDDPDLVISMDDATFDNDTFRIFTEGTSTMHGDEVPVIGRGKQVDFDGQGLELRWDERLHRILSLDIAHGHRLLIKNPGAMTAGPAHGDRGPGAATRASDTALAGAGGTPVTPAAPPDATAAPRTIVTAEPTRPMATAATLDTADHNPLYRANFRDNVRVFQGGVEKITSDVMHVDFRMATQSQSPATQPAAGSGSPAASNGSPGVMADAGQTHVPAPPNTSAPGDSGRSVSGGSTSGGSPAAGPVTQPVSGTLADSQPVEVFWTGKMHLSPIEPADANGPPPGHGQAIVRFDGKPVHIHQETQDITCVRATYRSADGVTDLESSDTIPLELTDADPNGQTSIIDTTSLLYTPLTGTALLGPGTARYRSKTDPSATLDARWTHRLTVGMTGAATTRPVIDRARLEGDVRIHQASMNVNGDSVDLFFDPKAPAATRPTTGQEQADLSRTLRRALADGLAVCEMIDSNDQSQIIRGDHLALDLSPGEGGKIYPHILNADGLVAAVSPDQELYCKHLEAVMSPAAPTTRSTAASADSAAAPGAPASGMVGSVRIDSMLATGDIKILGSNGSSGHGQQLTMKRGSAGPRLTLDGTPLAPAVAGNSESSVTGPELTFLPDEHSASVAGAGSLHAVQHDTTAATRPMDITWTTGSVFSGPDNLADVTGNVHILSPAPGGEIDDANSDHLKLILIPKSPTTRPGTATVGAAGSSAGADTPDNGGATDFMNGKQISQAQLLGHAEARSLLAMAGGAIAHRFDVISDEIDYNTIGHTMTVPTAGKMLIEEGGNPATRPAGGAPAGGVTALQWAKRMVYDQVAHRAELEGPVLIGHRDNAPGAKLIQITADHVEATFADAAVGGAAAAHANARGPATGPADPATGPAQRLKAMVAQGNVRVTFVDNDLEINGDNITDDPDAGELVIRGTADRPGTILGNDGRTNASFSQIWLDSRTGEVRRILDMQGRMQPGTGAVRH